MRGQRTAAPQRAGIAREGGEPIGVADNGPADAISSGHIFRDQSGPSRDRKTQTATAAVGQQSDSGASDTSVPGEPRGKPQRSKGRDSPARSRSSRGIRGKAGGTGHPGLPRWLLPANTMCISGEFGSGPNRVRCGARAVNADPVHVGHPISASTVSPHRSRPGSRRWPGFGRKS